MKLLFIILFVFSCQISFGEETISEEKNDILEFKITLNKNKYLHEDSIKLNYSIKNMSNSIISMNDTRIFLLDYSVILTDKKGKKVSFTKYGEKELNIEPFGISGKTLKNGESFSYEEIMRKNILLSRLFDFSLSGEYALQLSRDIYLYNTNKKVTIYSNKINFLVSSNIRTKEDVILEYNRLDKYDSSKETNKISKTKGMELLKSENAADIVRGLKLVGYDLKAKELEKYLYDNRIVPYKNQHGTWNNAVSLTALNILYAGSHTSSESMDILMKEIGKLNIEQ